MEHLHEQRNPTGRVQFPMHDDAYKILCQIGLSDHSIVYKAICCKQVNSEPVAVKVIDVDQLGGRDVSQFIADINSLSLINHAHILSPHCCFNVGRQVWIVMPYIRPGPLQCIIPAQFPEGLPDQFMATLLNGLLRGLVHLHKYGYVLKDIKISNIFIDDGMVMLSSDASIFKPKTATKDCSVPYWLAPEVTQGEGEDQYTSKSDVWSIGIVAMEIAYGKPLIPEGFAYNGMVISKLNLMNFPYLLKDFVSCCLVENPIKRPSTVSLLDHPFIKEGQSSNSNYLLRSIGKDNLAIEDRFAQFKEHVEAVMKHEDLEDLDSMKHKNLVALKKQEDHVALKKHMDLSEKHEDLLRKYEDFLRKHGDVLKIHGDLLRIHGDLLRKHRKHGDRVIDNEASSRSL